MHGKYELEIISGFFFYFLNLEIYIYSVLTNLLLTYSKPKCNVVYVYNLSKECLS